MGVDLQTYRAKIGTFRHSVGTDVLTIVCYVNFSGGLKSVGSVVFIGILLLIAGIESNPGPKDDGSEDQKIPKPTAIKITGLPDNVDEVILESFFENTKRQGGGPVKRVFFDVSTSSAVIEFEEAEAVEIVLSKRPISIGKKTVNIEIHTNDDDEEQIPKLSFALKVTNLPDSVDEESLKEVFESQNQNGEGAIKKVDFYTEEKKAIIEFKELNDVERVLEKQPILILGKEISVSWFPETDEKVIPKRSFAVQVTNPPDRVVEETLKQVSENQNEYHEGAIKSNTNENNMAIEFETASEEQDTLSSEYESLGSEEEETRSSSAEFESLGSVDVSGDPDNTAAYDKILHILGICKYSEKKLTLKDVLTIDPSESKSEKRRYLNELPLLFLKKLVSANSDSLDLSLYNLRCVHDYQDSQTSTGSVSAIYERKRDTQIISPLDLMLLTFQCCDPEVKQVVFQKLYLCKLAVPFIYLDCFSKKTVFSVWPLRNIVIENKVNHNENCITETEVIDMPTVIVTFGRYGRPRFSKSKLLNNIVCEGNGETFFNKDCQWGSAAKYATDGYAEMFWLPTVGVEKSLFSEPLTFINLRGDIASRFFEMQQPIIASISDILVVFVDIRDILDSNTYLKTTFEKYKIVLVVICSPVDKTNAKIRKGLEQFQSTAKTKLNTMVLTISTHSGKIKKNLRDLSGEIKNNISNCLQSTTLEPNTLQIRLDDFRTEMEKNTDKIITDTKSKTAVLNSGIKGNSLTIETDEGEECENARNKAMDLFKTIVATSSQESWIKKVTPVQFIYSKKLGILLKEMHFNKEVDGYGKIKDKITNVKKLQTEKVTDGLVQFIIYLLEYKESPQSLHYFLVWLKLFFEKAKRKTLAQLYQEHKYLWSKYRTLKQGEMSNSSELKIYETKIQESQSQIDEASFGVDNLFREVAHLYDALMFLNQDPKSIKLPDVDIIATIFANLIANGHTFELLDGNSLYITELWNTKLFEAVHEKINGKKVLALSVLGLQSSGKSTLLNTMFGVHFTASAGRCTRGIHAQLVPLHNFLDSQRFEYVLVIDTEGLRAPGLKETNYKGDNELATIITGLGDITIMNVKGENTAEIRDVLQTVVHAFIRLKMTNRKVDMKKSCVFVHQNVAELSSSEKVAAELHATTEVLDKVTRESAEFEGISNVITFDQVIRFNPEADVWYLPNLWKGNPPLAQINRKYSERVVKINHNILMRALSNTEKSYKSLKDIAAYTKDLWKGVLSENFVFSFRNSIEKKAFVALEQVLKDQFWKTEENVDTKLYRLCEDKLSMCETCEQIKEEKRLLKAEMEIFINKETASILKCIEDYFNNNDYQETTIQWETKTLDQIKKFSKETYEKKEPEIDNLVRERECYIITTAANKANEEFIREKSDELAARLRGKNLCEDEIDIEFEKIWQSFVNKSFNSKASGNPSLLKHVFVQRLTIEFQDHCPILFTVLADYKMLENRVEVQSMSCSFEQIGIDQTDISLKGFVNRFKGKLSNKKKQQYFKIAITDLINTLRVGDKKIDDLLKQYGEITAIDVGKFFHAIYSVMKQNLSLPTNDFSVTITFYIKSMVFISSVALTLFEEHNKRHQELYGVDAKLKRYKIQIRERFDMHLKDRKKEETAGIPFRHTISDYIRETVLKNMAMKTKQSLKPLLPSTKYVLIVRMLKEIVEEGSFESFMHYIRSPKSYAEIWVKTEAEHILFGNSPSKYYDIASTEKHKYINDLKTAVLKSSAFFSEMPTISEWINYINENLEFCKLSPSRWDKVKNEFEEETRVNVQNFKTTLLGEIDTVEARLDKEFQSITKNSVSWIICNPYDDLFNDIWGCNEECMFCGEPCKIILSKHPGNHECLQHRPAGLMGSHFENSKEFATSTCNFFVSGDQTVKCSFFEYRCNLPHAVDCSQGKHFYREYKKYFDTWDIDPSKDMEETSKFWYWFIGKYKNELVKKYSIKLSNVPSRWSNFSADEAVKSLTELYG